MKFCISIFKLITVALALRASGSELTLGVLLPSDPAESASLRRGVETAIAQKSTSALKISAVMRQRGSQWGAEGQEAAEMVVDEGAQALIAPADGASAHLALQVAGRTAVPVISLCPDSSVLGAGIPWSLRIAPGTREQALTLFTNVNARRWCAIVPSNRSGREAASDLTAAARICGRALTITWQTNLCAGIKTILSIAPDAVMIWSHDAAAVRLAIQEMRAAKFDKPITVPFSLYPLDCDALIARPAVDAALHSRFAAQFAARFSTRPDATAALAYDAAHVIIALLTERNDGKTSSFQDRAGGLSLRGVTGSIQFDATGNRLVALHAGPARTEHSRDTLP